MFVEALHFVEREREKGLPDSGSVVIVNDNDRESMSSKIGSDRPVWFES